MRAPRPAALSWRAALCAGIAAGILSTLVQLALWAALTDALPTLLYRDARFAAAIVMGPRVLPPPASFDGTVMFVATLVHLTLSIIYAFVLSALITRLSPAVALLAGAAFGLLVYGLNMYGFTTVFPWFEEDRDWITAAAHVAFGVIAAGVYKALTLPAGWSNVRRTARLSKRGQS
jgi:hypothetical protein